MDELDPKKYGPFAVRDQIIALSATVVQIYGVLIHVQLALPDDKQKEVQEQMTELTKRMTDLISRLEGKDG